MGIGLNALDAWTSWRQYNYNVVLESYYNNMGAMVITRTCACKKRHFKQAIAVVDNTRFNSTELQWNISAAPLSVSFVRACAGELRKGCHALFSLAKQTFQFG